MPIPHALSPLASPRESNSLFKLWQHTAKVSQSARTHGRALTEHQNKLSAIQSPRIHSYGMHPFKIYQLPAALRIINGVTLDPTKDWRTFRVRAGVVLSGDATGILPDKTDKVGFPYDDIFLHQVDGTVIGAVQEIIVPDSTDFFYFWVETTGGGSTMTAVVRWHTDPTQTSYTDAVNPSCNWTSTNAWASFPSPDSEHIIIGFVNTSSSPGQRAYVRQDLTTDIGSSGGSGFPVWL